MSKTKVLHFNNYGHTALTIASQELPPFSGWFVLGMALAHKKDNGSKSTGKALALESLQEGLDDPYLFTLISEMKGPILGQKGHYIVHGLDTVKKIVNWLRYAEHHYANSKVNSIFHRAFFQLPETWENYVKYDSTL